MGAGAQVAVIDPGPDLPDHIEALKRALGRRQVSHILVTHTHRDHSPAAAALKAWSGAKDLWIAAWLSRRIANGEGMVDEAHDHDFVPDMTVQDGMRIAATVSNWNAWRRPVIPPTTSAMRWTRRKRCSPAIM